MGVEYHLRSHILISTAESGSFCVNIFSSPSKIAQLNIPKLVNQQILWLYIPVHDIVRMQIFNRFYSLGKVHESLWLSELALVALVVEKVASFGILQNHVQVF